ncbi:putative methylmalonyl-CoA epimerase [Phytophthora infestans]|nr:putative methylmalonyl-CoA epimerase [Phytophthora infestans]
MKEGSFRSEKENVDEDILQCGKGPFAVEVDIMQPIDPDKAPKGVRITPGGIRKGAAGISVAFIHPKGNDATALSGEGVLIELVQAPDNIIKAFEAIKEK